MELFDWIFIFSGFIFFIIMTAVLFIVTKEKMDLVKKLGYFFVALIIPLIVVLINYILTRKDPKFLIYIVLILSYLIIESLLDLVLKYDFRSKKRTHVPYIILEHAACFSFIFGSISLNIIMGWITSILFWVFLGMLIYYIIYQKKHKT